MCVCITPHTTHTNARTHSLVLRFNDSRPDLQVLVRVLHIVFNLLMETQLFAPRTLLFMADDICALAYLHWLDRRVGMRVTFSGDKALPGSQRSSSERSSSGVMSILRRFGPVCAAIVVFVVCCKALPIFDQRASR
jgi:hypothetical protein